MISFWISVVPPEMDRMMDILGFCPHRYSQGGLAG